MIACCRTPQRSSRFYPTSRVATSDPRSSSRKTLVTTTIPACLIRLIALAARSSDGLSPASLVSVQAANEADPRTAASASATEGPVDGRNRVVEMAAARLASRQDFQDCPVAEVGRLRSQFRQFQRLLGPRVGPGRREEGGPGVLVGPAGRCCSISSASFRRCGGRADKGHERDRRGRRRPSENARPHRLQPSRPLPSAFDDLPPCAARSTPSDNRAADRSPRQNARRAMNSFRFR